MKALAILGLVSFASLSIVHAQQEVAAPKYVDVAPSSTSDTVLSKGLETLQSMIKDMKSYGDYVKTYVYAHELNVELLKSIKDSKTAEQATVLMKRFEELGVAFEQKTKELMTTAGEKIENSADVASEALKTEFQKVSPQIIKVRMETSKLMEELGAKAYYGSKKLADFLAPKTTNEGEKPAEDK